MPKTEKGLVLVTRLSAKRKRFVEEYLIDLNATQAAIRAGYSPKTAMTTAYLTKQEPEVAAEIARRQKELMENLGLSQERVLREYLKLAYANILDFCSVKTERILVGYTKDGEPISEVKNIVTFRDDFDELPDSLISAISEISESPSAGLKIKLHDKQKALDSLAKHLGLFVDRVEMSGKDGGPIDVRPDLSKLSIEELKSLEEILTRASPNTDGDQD